MLRNSAIRVMVAKRAQESLRKYWSSQISLRNCGAPAIRETIGGAAGADIDLVPATILVFYDHCSIFAHGGPIPARYRPCSTSRMRQDDL